MSYFQKSESILNIAITDPNGLNALPTVTAVKCKGTCDAAKTDDFSEKFLRGGGGEGGRGGVIINPKIHVADFRPLNRGKGRLE